MLEFALTAPILILMIFFTVDVGRLTYTYSAVSDAAREGARLVSTYEEIYNDCYAIQMMEQVGQGFPLRMDPNSIAGDSDPNNPAGVLQPSTPPPGMGYIYIWPAVSTQVPQENHCTSTVPRGGSQTIRHVAVQVEYHYQPITPPVAQFSTGFVVKTISVVQVEY